MQNDERKQRAPASAGPRAAARVRWHRAPERPPMACIGALCAVAAVRAVLSMAGASRSVAMRKEPSYVTRTPHAWLTRQ